ncbi:MYXO-CTERM sorting domain-containing protein [Nannocystaceae bacterium ST9]
MRITRITKRIALGLVLGSMLAPASAWAGNGTHPRTPVSWSDAPCMTIVDRSVSPIHSFGYSIPYEDVDVTPDEVPDSRTHQFFAYCRDRHLEEILPSWITEADAMAAAAKGLGELADVDLELQVLENVPEWADCWTRITADDQRRPITFAAAAEPVEWDTTALPAGTWVVEGYTYEPWFNMWTPHPGVFKIVDDPDPAASPPAAALTFTEQTVTFGDSGTVSGCVDAMPGSTMTLSWALSAFGNEPQWHEFASDVPVEGASFELAFAPTIEAVSSSVLIRLDVSDPLARSWTAHAIEYIAVVENVGDEGCDEGTFVVGDPCDTGTGSETGAVTGDGVGDELGSESGPTLNDDADSGGGCRASEPSPLALGLGLLALAQAARRRRSPASPSSASPSHAPRP